MSQNEKLFRGLLCGAKDNDFRFQDLQKILKHLEFSLRVRGDHFIYAKEGIAEIINLQPTAANKAKPYQVAQVRAIVNKYNLGGNSIEI